MFCLSSTATYSALRSLLMSTIQNRLEDGYWFFWMTPRSSQPAPSLFESSAPLGSCPCHGPQIRRGDCTALPAMASGRSVIQPSTFAFRAARAKALPSFS